MADEAVAVNSTTRPEPDVASVAHLLSEAEAIISAIRNINTQAANSLSGELQALRAALESGNYSLSALQNVIAGFKQHAETVRSTANTEEAAILAQGFDTQREFQIADDFQRIRRIPGFENVRYDDFRAVTLATDRLRDLGLINPNVHLDPITIGMMSNNQAAVAQAHVMLSMSDAALSDIVASSNRLIDLANQVVARAEADGWSQAQIENLQASIRWLSIYPPDNLEDIELRTRLMEEYLNEDTTPERRVAIRGFGINLGLAIQRQNAIEHSLVVVNHNVREHVDGEQGGIFNPYDRARFAELLRDERNFFGQSIDINNLQAADIEALLSEDAVQYANSVLEEAARVNHITTDELLARMIQNPQTFESDPNLQLASYVHYLSSVSLTELRMQHVITIAAQSPETMRQMLESPELRNLSAEDLYVKLRDIGIVPQGDLDFRNDFIQLLDNSDPDARVRRISQFTAIITRPINIDDADAISARAREAANYLATQRIEMMGSKVVSNPDASSEFVFRPVEAITLEPLAAVPTESLCTVNLEPMAAFNTTIRFVTASGSEGNQGLYDGSGINAAEQGIIDALSNVSQTELQEIRAALAGNGGNRYNQNDTISYNEVENKLYEIFEGRYRTGIGINEGNELFKVIDVNGDGELSLGELRVALNIPNATLEDRNRTL